VTRLLTKIYGARPARDASKLDRLRYVRRVAYLSNLPGLAVCVAFIAVLLATPLNWVLPLVFGVPWLVGFATINLQIRRERGRSVCSTST
jgi:hypothetical protein